MLQLGFVISSPAAASAHVGDHADGRRVGAVRRAERVVDVGVRSGPPRPPRTRGRWSSSAGVEAQVLEQHDAARHRPGPAPAATGSPIAVGREDHRAAEQLRQARRDRPQRELGIRGPLRPAQVRSRRRSVAPRSRESRRVGSAARMRVSSPTTPSRRGTLKSTRTNSRRPSRSRSRIGFAWARCLMRPGGRGPEALPALQSLGRQELDEVHAAGRVAPFVVVPREHLDEVALHHASCTTRRRSTNADSP